MAEVLRAIWEFPQFILSLLILPFSDRKTVRRVGAVRIISWKYSSGLSLGLLAFVPRYADSAIIRHEYGHTRASLCTGPLYLLIIGIPSFLWAVLKSAGLFRNKDYFSFYTERWAEKEGKTLIL